MLTGLDISTPAVKAAAKRLDQCSWLVANAFRLPVMDASQDLITHMFSRPCSKEAARVLKTDGLLIDVAAGSGHLLELREQLYPNLKERHVASSSPYENEFKQVASEELNFNFTLCNAEEIAALIGMTPHTWRASQDRIVATCALASLELSAHIELRAYTRK